MGSKRSVAVDGSEDKVKLVKAEGLASKGEEKEAPKTGERAGAKKAGAKVNPRSKRYQARRALVDRSKFYPVAEAVALVKKTSYASFGGTVSADLVLKEPESQIRVSFPFSTGKSLRIEIVDEALLEKIAAGKIDFDILLTTAGYMPKLAKLARILGPKGLMPNPKNGTIVSDPEKVKRELAGGKTTLKTERKVPLLHVTLGKLSAKEEELVANFEALTKVLTGKIVKAVLSASMSPGVKVQI